MGLHDGAGRLRAGAVCGDIPHLALCSIIFFPLGAFMGYLALPRFMLAYPFLTLFKDSVLLAYGLTAVQLVLQAVLFGWLARRRTIEQQLLLASIMLVALATAVTLLASALDFRRLTLSPGLLLIRRRVKTSNGLARLIAQVVTQLGELAGPRPRVLVAFSGGVDSTLLAYVLARQRRQLAGLRLVHVDHGLQAASAEWARHCAALRAACACHWLSSAREIERGRGESPEAAARAARYALLAQAMKPGEVIVTAQHRDDQVETLLLQLFRGAGVAGLAAMPRFAPFGPGHLARPLLDFSRREIEVAARAAKLHWIEDPSNRDVRFSRNFLRHRLLPSIREHWPGVDRALARTARNLAEAQALLVERGHQDLAVGGRRRRALDQRIARVDAGATS